MAGFKVETRRPDGTPMCFVCGTEVPEAGQSCSPPCWEHFVSVVSNQTDIVEIEAFIDSAEQPWGAFTEEE